MFWDFHLGWQGGENDLEDFYSATDNYEERLAGLERGWELHFQFCVWVCVSVIPQMIKSLEKHGLHIAGEM